MAIRLRHDVAALGANLASGGSSNRKYGQQLVLQRQKYDQDQLNAMQDRAFDMQKQWTQNAWQEERDFRNNLVARMAAEQEQDFRAKQAREAREFNEQGMAKQRQQAAFEGNVDMATKMAQEALKRDDVPGPVKERLRNLIGGAVAIRGKEFDDPQVSTFVPEYYSGVSAALADVPPPVPLYEQMNKNLVYRLPDGLGYVNPKDYPEGTPFVVKDAQSGREWISSSAGQPQMTPFESFAQENRKDAYGLVSNEIARLSEKVATGDMQPFGSEEELRMAALRNVQSIFNLSAGSPGQAVGQPAAPQVAPTQQQPAPQQRGAVSPAVMNAVGNVLNTFPDTEMMAMSQLGREALVENGFPQGQVQSPMVPPVVMPTDRAGMVSAGVPQGGAGAAAVPQQVPASVAAPMQSGDTMSQNAPSAQPFTMDMIGEAIKTFESGTPEQKVALRERFADPQALSTLDEQASSGNEEAAKALDFLAGSLSPSEVLADKVRIAKTSASGAMQVIGELQKMKEAGVLDDFSYTSAIIDNSGKSAKENYIEFRGKKGKKLNTAQTEGIVFDQLWDEMGMFDSNPVVRAFQRPTMEQVLERIQDKGKMSREQAEEYLYNQILSRKYAGKFQKRFEDSLAGNMKERRAQERRDAWTPVAR